jgi:hypothetical protein
MSKCLRRLTCIDDCLVAISGAHEIPKFSQQPGHTDLVDCSYRGAYYAPRYALLGGTRCGVAAWTAVLACHTVGSMFSVCCLVSKNFGGLSPHN